MESEVYCKITKTSDRHCPLSTGDKFISNSDQIVFLLFNTSYDETKSIEHKTSFGSRLLPT